MPAWPSTANRPAVLRPDHGAPLASRPSSTTATCPLSSTVELLAPGGDRDGQCRAGVADGPDLGGQLRGDPWLGQQVALQRLRGWRPRRTPSGPAPRPRPAEACRRPPYRHHRSGPGCGAARPACPLGPAAEHGSNCEPKSPPLEPIPPGRRQAPDLQGAGARSHLQDGTVHTGRSRRESHPLLGRGLLRLRYARNLQLRGVGADQPVRGRAGWLVPPGTVTVGTAKPAADASALAEPSGVRSSPERARDPDRTGKARAGWRCPQPG